MNILDYLKELWESICFYCSSSRKKNKISTEEAYKYLDVNLILRLVDQCTTRESTTDDIFTEILNRIKSIELDTLLILKSYCGHHKTKLEGANLFKVSLFESVIVYILMNYDDERR